ncbi:MAG: 3-hydroxy-5-phosphonooxypentane-2,4-dione thiolase [Opitutales bacterium]|nr:3-hydroxy-5-phosphonooxypentane-2,4-dione thiolase [Opitutales bacterium]
MADNEGNIEADNFALDVKAKSEAFYLKGLQNADWGVKSRMSRIFNRKSGRAVMLAFDHGYIMGPTRGLERMDLSIVPLIKYADCVMCTRGALRTIVPPECGKPVALRWSAGSTVLTELNDECLIDIEDAVKLDACALAPMVAIGGAFEAKTIQNLAKTADMTAKYGIPTLGVTAVGKELGRDARYLGLACRVITENGATFVKTYYCDEGFEKVVAACPVPIVIAGGKKLPEAEALELAYKAVNDGAAGVDMGRNIFQSECPEAMIQAVRAVVHENASPKDAFEMFNDLQHEIKKL